MNYTFKLKKENNLYLKEFIDELLRVYDNVNVSIDDEYYYISLTKTNEDETTFRDECINEGFI